MSLPLVSIVIPTFNQRPDFLRASLSSALSQRYPSLEVVVSNNHSTNDTPSLLTEFVDPRLRIVQPPQHLPLTEHFAFAIDQAKGKYFSILSSDDWVYPNWLEKLMPMVMACPSAVIGFGEIADVKHNDLDRINFLYRDGSLETGYYTAEQILPMICKFNRKSAWTVGNVINAEAYRRSGGIGYGGFKYSSDWGLIVCLLEHGGVVYLNDVLGKYRSWDHADGKVDALRFAVAVEDIVKSYGMLERSGPLSSIVSNQKQIIAAAKQSKARTFVLGMLEAISLGNLSDATLQQAKAHLIELDPSWLMKGLMTLCKPSAAPLFRAVYPFARTAFRSELGRRIRGRRVPATG